eukprot:TRINITY_DN3147_c0_g1_i1.p1 TRINITY_DN3147_c0_g1~~TRINITY_DN3147_c0_g1_i1.p1  ORF type:complete len:229 (-),score=83.03 TRINITY_DN3147_c0_g1_i1:92-778(-)
MNKCALELCETYSEAIVFAYGESDEYSFVLKRECKTFERRTSKIVSTFASLFSSSYVFYWNSFFPDEKLQKPPTFDARAVCYPTTKNLRDYLSWRQVDCHINNMYNLCFWKLVQSGVTAKDAENQLKGTLSKDKNDLLFEKFGVNYNNEDPMFRKGSSICRQWKEIDVTNSKTGEPTKRRKLRFSIIYEDIINDEFWTKNAHILNEEVETKEKKQKNSKENLQQKEEV